MTSSPKKIIRDARVSGVLFCTPQGTHAKDPLANKEQENLQALETFWQKKGVEEGRKQGFDEGFAAGLEEGQKKGVKSGLEEGEEKGFSRGLEQGKKEGEQQLIAKVTELVQVLQRGANELKEHQEALYEESKAEIVAFSVQVCKRVLQGQLKDPQLIEEIMVQVVHKGQSLIRDCPVEILLAPTDLEKLNVSQIKERLSEMVEEDASSLRILADDSVQEGDCRLETQFGLINFSVERLLADLEHKVLEIREEDSDCSLKKEAFDEPVSSK